MSTGDKFSSEKNSPEEAQQLALVSSKRRSRKTKKQPHLTPESRLLLVSAASKESLTQRIADIQKVVEQQPSARDDIAYTLLQGRRQFPECASMVLATATNTEAETVYSWRILQGKRPPTKPSLVFTFPGQGTQFLGMARELYEDHPSFQEFVDHCDDVFEPLIGVRIKEFIAPSPGADHEALTEQLKQTAIAQPALFVVEAGLAKLLIDLGIKPDSLIGHSIGEYAAAYLAEVFTLDQVLKLVATRGRLMQSMPPGSMLAVKAAPADLLQYCQNGVDLAANNAPGSSVLAGPTTQIESLAEILNTRGIESRLVLTSHAFHSAMMVPILEEFATEVAKSNPKAPQISIISTMTGTELTAEQALTPEYWAKQLRNPVMFADAAAQLCDDENRVFVELGPGCTLTTFVATVAASKIRPRKLMDSLGHPKSELPAMDGYLSCLGQLWLQGVDVHWEAVLPAKERKLLRLPVYPYNRKFHFINPPPLTSAYHQPTPLISNTVELQDRLAPDTTVFNHVVDLLCERLGNKIEDKDLDCSFIELGFDSLALSQLIGKLRQVFGLKLPVKRLFEDLNSPRQLSEFIANNTDQTQLKSNSINTHPSGSVQTLQGTPGVPSGIEVRLENIERQIEKLTVSLFADHMATDVGSSGLTPPQQEIWAAVKTGGDSANIAYNESRCFWFHGNLDKVALLQSLNELYHRHDGLRILFSDDGKEYFVQKSARLILTEHDLSDLSDNEKTNRLSALTSELVTTPMNLETGPLFRGHFVVLSTDEVALLMCAHHIIVDGSSWEILIRELSALYNARLDQTPATLPPPTSISEFRRLRKIYGNSVEAREDLRFWRSHLNGQSEDLSLPSDKNRTPQRSLNSTRIDQLLTAELSRSLRKSAAALGCTAQTFLLTAFSVLIHRLTRQTDFVIGIPTSGQAAEGFESCIGHCVNVLPLRTNFDDNLTLGEYSKSLHKNLLEAIEHQRSSFSRIVQSIKRPRDSSRPTLVQVAFGMGRSTRQPEFKGLQTEVSVPPRSSENFELYVYVTALRNDELEVSWSYNTDLFLEQTIRGWQRSFEATLYSLIDTTSQQPMRDINVLASEDRARLLKLARGPQVHRSEHIPVHLRIAATAESHPDHIAIHDIFGSYSYQEVNTAANQLARYVISLGPIQPALVAVCLDRTVTLVTTLLGVWRAGLGYIPLDPTYPDNRIEMILEDSQVSVVLTSRVYAERFSNRNRVIFLEDIEGELKSFSSLAPQVDYRPENCAYAIFTSGSTGRPKGVQIPQKAAENFICSMANEPGFTPSDTLLAITTIAFDISVLELFLPLTVGGSLVISTASQTREPKVLQELISKFNINVMQATPATWQLLFDGGWRGHRGLKVLCGGEAFPRPLASKLLETCGDIWNVYGPTETTVWSSTKQITEADHLTIGRPIDNTTMYVLDDQLRLLPAGAQGELWIGGHGVADGYMGRPDLTAERFVKNPVDPQERIYRTGDLARIRADGEFECLGRADFQIKIRGFRVELGEIETALLSHERINASVVVAQADDHNDRGQKMLVAYLVKEDQQPLDLSELRSYLIDKLPAYMVPHHFMVLPELPLTPNKKVDRNALPKITNENISKIDVPTPPNVGIDHIEVEVLKIFRQHMNNPSLKPTDNFFNLGGDSLLAIQIIRALENRFGQSLSVNAFLEKPTVRQLTDILERVIQSRNPVENSSNSNYPKVIRHHQGLFQIQEGKKDGPLLFLIHGDQANQLLPPQLPPTFEIWGYHHQGADGDRISYETVESIAQICHEEWLAEHGDRSCILVGHSFGALVTYHVAILRQKNQLETRGIVLLDARNPTFLPGRRLPKNPKQIMRWLDTRKSLKRAKQRVDTATSYINRGERVLESDRSHYVLGTYLLAAYKYNPPVLKGNLSVIRSHEFAKISPNDGWNSVVSGEIHTVIVPECHLTMVRSAEGVKRIAQYIADLA